ncbi:pilus assembly protein PilZ [Methylomonas koyamae]|uniref:Cyclic diguanosine monophosphate-binding protein n=1 Tax=Methylomonas koyamae TaxID=702114 RepID=A0A177NRI0_9GAMM|nr:PilZ domain-containing protein [Methylomonas koyamae]OAI19913.1 pilus assembly protein PilZ [Methylomonas koyamae]
MSEKNEEKRRFHRIFYHADAQLVSAEGVVQSCRIIDLSLRGCLLELAEPLAGIGDQPYQLKFELSAEAAIRMEIVATHVQGNQAGFRCAHIDIDSISLLRRLVELNLGDSELLERELSALGNFS